MSQDTRHPFAEESYRSTSEKGKHSSSRVFGQDITNTRSRTPSPAPSVVSLPPPFSSQNTNAFCSPPEKRFREERDVSVRPPGTRDLSNRGEYPAPFSCVEEEEGSTNWGLVDASRESLPRHRRTTPSAFTTPPRSAHPTNNILHTNRYYLCQPAPSERGDLSDSNSSLEGVSPIKELSDANPLPFRDANNELFYSGVGYRLIGGSLPPPHTPLDSTLDASNALLHLDHAPPRPSSPSYTAAHPSDLAHASPPFNGNPSAWGFGNEEGYPYPLHEDPVLAQRLEESWQNVRKQLNGLL